MDQSKPDAVPDYLLWVKDAPLFMDELNLGRFYDAALRPAFDENAPVKLKLTEAMKEDIKNKYGAKGNVGLANWLSFIASSSVELAAEHEKTKSQSQGSETEILLQPIATPHRQLEQLTIFYLLGRPSQLLVGGPEDVLLWHKESLGLSVPRPLVFIDLPKRSKIIPMAAEFVNGKVITLFDKLPADNGERPPKYDRDHKNEYWNWFDKNFNPDTALTALEEAATDNGRIEWVDFRVPIGEIPNTMHLHIEVAGKYNTGTFGYRLIRRGEGHGVRIVGSLRDGPDVNVLALYEK
ncbi:hypothetical protein [Bradyrhizobium sp. CB1015]|uniref:hypothetical protein n=1 Tax=Bradyrhizobium sp. CB1015 TaxID=2976822 RepID=UPI0021A9E4EF|nr:hypothetical protein [Bradyrhizobium sp. CB1015]UWU92958.1 hypothetical protein N2604_03075 [Bradyrhizobium sp. CB1015]